MSLSKQASEKN